MLDNTRTRVKKWHKLRKEKRALKSEKKREEKKERKIRKNKEWEKKCKEHQVQCMDDVFAIFGLQLQLQNFAITENN